MDELETKLLDLSLKSPSDALDRRVLGDADVRPTLQPSKRRLSHIVRGRVLIKATAVVLAAVVLVGAGWAGEKVYRKIASRWVVVLDKPKVEKWKLADGQEMFSGQSTATVVDASDPKAAEKAKRDHEEMTRLIGEKKFELVRTFDAAGEKQYVYRFTLADGDSLACNFSMPLDKVSSWEDYQQRAAAQRQKRQEQIAKAIAAGKFRLLDVDVYCIHVCRDVSTNRKIRVQRLVDVAQHVAATAPAGKESKVQAAAGDRALVRPFDAEDQAVTMPQTSWQEHLDAIRKGDRILLSLDTTPSYTYEITLEDGTKTVFSYGGGPLKQPDNANAEKK